MIFTNTRFKQVFIFTLLFAIASLVDQVDSAAAIHDIATYNSAGQACAGDCDQGNRTPDVTMTHGDNTMTKVVYAIRYCNTFIPLGFDALCSLQFYFTDGSSTSYTGTGITCSSSCTTRTFNSSAAPKPIRYFRGYHRTWSFVLIPKVSVLIASCACWSWTWVWTTVTSEVAVSYDMATGFYLIATDGTSYSFGSNFNVDHGIDELNGRINGLRYDSVEAWDRMSFRVTRCALVNNYPQTFAAETTNTQSFMQASASNYVTSSYCYGDTFSMTYSTDASTIVTFDSANAMITIASPTNRTMFIKAYTIVLTQTPWYGDAAITQSMTFTITTGSICQGKTWRTATSSMPSTVLTGADSQTLVDRTLEHDADGTSWTTVCSATAGLSVLNNDVFVTIYNSDYVRILPLYVQHCGAKTFDLKQSLTGITTDGDTSYSVTISPDCAVKTWVTLTGYPTSSDAVLLTGSAAFTYTVSKDLEDDSDPAGAQSWSVLCGQATISITNMPPFMTLDQSTGIISIAPTSVAHVGVWNYDIVRTVSGVTQIDTVSCQTTVHPVCSDKLWQPFINVPTTDVDMESVINVTIPLLLEVDDQNVTWSDVCGGNAAITLENNPSFITGGNKTQIKPVYVSNLGSYTFTVHQRGGVAPLGGDATTDYQQDITIRVVCPGYVCMRKEWQPVTAEGADLENLSMGNTVTFNVPYELELDGDSPTEQSWSIACTGSRRLSAEDVVIEHHGRRLSGTATPVLQGAPSFVNLQAYTVTVFPFLIADVGDWSFSIWQIGNSITSPKENVVAMSVYCDSSGSADCLRPVLASGVSKGNKVQGDAWSYTLPEASDPIGMTITISMTFEPSTARTWLIYTQSSNTFTVAPNAVGEEVGSFDINILVSAPGRNVGDEDRVSEYTMSLDVRAASEVLIEDPTTCTGDDCEDATESETTTGTASVTGTETTFDDLCADFGCSLTPTTPVGGTTIIYIYVLIQSCGPNGCQLQVSDPDTEGSPTGCDGGDDCDITTVPGVCNGPACTCSGTTALCDNDPSEAEEDDPIFEEEHLTDPSTGGVLVQCIIGETAPEGYECAGRDTEPLIEIYGPDCCNTPDVVEADVSNPDEEELDPETVAQQEAAQEYFELLVASVQETKQEAEALGVTVEEYQMTQPGSDERKNPFKAQIEKVTPVGEVVLEFTEPIHFVKDQPMPNNRTMEVEYLKYGTEEYFEHQRMQGIDVESAPVMTQANQERRRRRLAEIAASTPDGEEPREPKHLPWGCANITDRNITLKMNFSDPYMISEDTDLPDILRVTFTKRYFFLSTVKNQPLPDNLSMNSGLPKQFASLEEEQLTENIASTTKTVIASTVIGSFFLQILLQKVIKKMWPLFNALQLIFLFLVYRIQVPTNVHMILKLLKDTLELGLGSIKPADLGIKGKLEVPEYTPMDMLIIFGIPSLIIGTGILGAVLYALKKFASFKKMLTNVFNSIFLTGILRSVFCLYIVLCTRSQLDQFSAGRNLSAPDFKQIIVVTLTLMFPFGFAVFVAVVSDKKLEEESFRKTFGSIYLGVEVKKGITAKMLMTFFFLRRLILVIFLTPTLGLIHYTLQSVASIVILCYYFTVKPWTDRTQYKLEVFNEMFLLFGFTYFTYMFSDFVPKSNDRFYYGWIFIYMLGAFIGTNLIILLIAVVQESILKLKQKSQIKKASKLKAEKDAIIAEKQEMVAQFKELDYDKQFRAFTKMGDAQKVLVLQNLTEEQVQTFQNEGKPLSISAKLKLKKAAEKQEKLAESNAWKSKFAQSLKSKVNKQAEFEAKAAKAQAQIMSGLKKMNGSYGNQSNSTGHEAPSPALRTPNMSALGGYKDDEIFNKMNSSTRSKSNALKQAAEARKAIKSRKPKFDADGNPL